MRGIVSAGPVATLPGGDTWAQPVRGVRRDSGILRVAELSTVKVAKGFRWADLNARCKVTRTGYS